MVNHQPQQEEAQAKIMALNKRQADKEEEEVALKRDILEIAIKGEERVKLTQKELLKQGDKVKLSLKDAEQIGKKIITVEETTNNLISEAKASNVRKVFNCFLENCCCFSICRKIQYAFNNDNNLPLNDDRRLLSKHLKSYEARDYDDHQQQEEELYNNTINQAELKDCLNKILSEDLIISDHKKENNWKRTLEPTPGLINYYEASVWYKQVDFSLKQMHQLVEELGQTLDEQVRLAQMLAVYLNFGIDKVVGVNENLASQKNIF